MYFSTRHNHVFYIYICIYKCCCMAVHMVTSQNVDKPKRRQPKRRQTKTPTNRIVDKPKRRQTETSTNQNVDRPKRRQTETSTNQNVDTLKLQHNSLSYVHTCAERLWSGGGWILIFPLRYRGYVHTYAERTRADLPFLEDNDGLERAVSKRAQ